MRVVLGSVAVVGPAEAGEGERAIEARVAVHEGVLALVLIVRGLELGVGAQSGRQLTVGHWEHLDEHQTGTIAVTTLVVRTDVALPGIVLGSIVDTREDGRGVILGEEDGLAVLYLCEDAGKVAAVHVVARRVQAITAGVDVVQVVLHLGIGIGPTRLVVRAVEQGAGPEQQQTALQCQGCSGGHATIVFVRSPSAAGGLAAQHVGSLLQVFKNEFVGGLRTGTIEVYILGGIEHLGHDGHTTIPLENVIVAPCTEEVSLSEQFVLVAFREVSAFHTCDEIVDIADAAIYSLLDIIRGSHEEIGHAVGGTHRREFVLGIHEDAEARVFFG